LGDIVVKLVRELAALLFLGRQEISGKPPVLLPARLKVRPDPFPLRCFFLKLAIGPGQLVLLKTQRALCAPSSGPLNEQAGDEDRLDDQDGEDREDSPPV
jgi:hypothetical protein